MLLSPLKARTPRSRRKSVCFVEVQGKADQVEDKIRQCSDAATLKQLNAELCGLQQEMLLSPPRSRRKSVCLVEVQAKAAQVENKIRECADQMKVAEDAAVVTGATTSTAEVAELEAKNAELEAKNAGLCTSVLGLNA